ncbi:phage tail spike protein [Gracilibacillus sp. HCP3S3_G5_1]|uniref:phage tail spike protein n=1 Tax=unclassified Gracilibacillus TaxID=2625209 RepID=UPI003F895FB2
MYEVAIINDDNKTVIHSPYINEIKLVNGQIKKEINKIDSFNIEFTPNNPAYGKLKPLKTHINVLNTLTNQYVFEGRVLSPSDNMTSDGLHSTSYECEGELAYLHDSQQRHLEFRGTPKELLTTILSYHNQQVEDFKQFEVGNVTVTNSTNNLYLYLSAEDNTYDTIFEKLIDRIGGELQIRKSNGVRYLDLIDRVGIDSNTEIRIARNLKSLSRDRNPTEIITRLTPLGTRIESEDEDDTDASEARLTIESVNNGIPYIDSPELIAEFGIQGGSETWDDITIPSNLLTAGQNWIANQKTSYTQYNVDVVDLSLIGKANDSFDIGNTYPIYNPIMGIDERLRVIGKSIDINAPEDDSLTIGDKFKTLKEYQAEANRSAQRVVTLENTINNQSQRISDLLNEVDNTKNEVDNVKDLLNNADLPELNEAIDNLQTAIDDLNDSLDDIPIYEPVTHSTDGLMIADDKVKLDLIEVINNINLDDLKDKLELLTVTQQIDLDQLYQDVQTLKDN